MTVDRIVVGVGGLVRGEMRDDLMPVEIEVDPGVTAATLGQTKDTAVKVACLGDITYGKGEMEGANRHVPTRRSN